MIRLARFHVAMPGKSAALLSLLKEVAAVIKSAAGVEVLVFASLGSHVGESMSVSNYNSLADFEEKATKILASADYQALVKKLDGLVVPGSSHDHLLRQV
jgi:hypothetical protein